MGGLEKKLKEAKKYSEFIMLLVYVFTFIHITTIIFIIFGIFHSGRLAYQLLFALIYIECKRDPEKESILWIFKVKRINSLT
jgi:hypothetical protein